VSSRQPVAAVSVIVDGAGLNDTAQSGPMISSITVRSRANLTASDSVFVEGAESQTIVVQVTIVAVPYINAPDCHTKSNQHTNQIQNSYAHADTDAHTYPHGYRWIRKASEDNDCDGDAAAVG
jgi:hypothetical protein